MQYDFILAGLGPSGITTALHLMKSGKSVLLFDSNSSLGGCWAHTYDKGVYFTEHSPKVLFSLANHDFKSLLNFLHVDPKLKSVYSKQTLVFASIIYHIFTSFHLWDYLLLFSYGLSFLINNQTTVDKRQTVYEWMVTHKISNSARDFFEMMCIVINGTSAKLIKMHNLFSFMSKPGHIFGRIVQLTNPNEWLYSAYNKLSFQTNIDIRFNATVHSIQTQNDVAKKVVIHTGEEFEAKQFILCVPIRNLLEISSRSDKTVQRNWFKSLEEFGSYVSLSSYSGIGIQFHFDETILSKRLWCWSCTSEWIILVVDKGNTLNSKDLSLDKNIKTVWSCVLCDTTTKNKNGKSPNDYENINDLTIEVLKQLSDKHGSTLSPKYTSISNTVYRDEYGWNSSASSFTNTQGNIPFTGVIKNLHTVGPHNMDEIVVIDSAIKSAKMFCKSVLKMNPLF